MNNTNKNIQIPKRFNNSLNHYSNLRMSPSQKYRNALMDLKKNLTELENLDNQNNNQNIKRSKNLNYQNEHLNTYGNNPNLNKLNIFQENKKYIGKNSGKNLSQIYNNSLVIPKNNINNINNSRYSSNIRQFKTFDNNSVKISKLNPQRHTINRYPNSAYQERLTQENNDTKINNQNDIVILKKQNIMYRRKINDLMKNMNLIQNENQRLKNDKNNLIKKISLIENEFKKNKEGFNIEMEKKNNNIMILKKEIMKLNILLNKKKDEVNDLKNKIIFNKGSEIKTLDDKMDGINNIIKENLNINEIINQNNSLKVQLENCQNQIVNIKNSYKLSQSENQKRVNELNKKLNILKAEKEKYSEKMKEKINENNEQKNKILNLEKQINNLNSSNNKNISNNNIEEFNLLKKDLELKKNEINNLNENIVNLTLDLNKQKNYNDVLAKDIFTLREEIDKYKKKEFDLEEENASKQCIIEDLNKKNIELKNKLNLIKTPDESNSNNNIINNVEKLFSDKVKALENKLKETKDIYQQNLEKLNKKQTELNNNNIPEEKEITNSKNNIPFSSVKNNFFNKQNISESEDNTDKLKKDVQENRYKIEQLENEIMTAKDMELTRLIYTVLENKGQNSQNQDIENSQSNIDKNYMYNRISSQLSDLLKINRLSNENQSKINSNSNNSNNEETISIKKDLEQKNNEISNLNEKIKDLETNLKTEKNKIKELSNTNKNLKEEIEKLNIKVSELTNENINNQQQILDLSNLNNILKIRVNSVHSGNFKLNAFRSEEHNQELEKQIQQLEQKNNDLQEKINSLSKASEINENMVKLIEEKQNLSKENLKLVAENLDLKNELLILKLQINENDENENENENDIMSGNEKYLINIESNIVKELEKKLEDTKKDYEKKLEELKMKENKYKLNNEKNKSENEENTDSIDTNNLDELKKDTEDKKIKIEELENEIKSIKNTEVTKMLNKYVLDNYNNAKNMEENNNNDIGMEEQIKLMQMDSSIMAKEDNFAKIIDKLKEEINEKNKKIEELTEENTNLKNMNTKKEEDENELNINIDTNTNKKEKENEIDLEKYKKLKNQVIELKEINSSDKMQIKALKEEIKELKEKIKKLETFSGQLNNFNEFIQLLQSALLNYKPKKKEQKAALNRLKEILNNHHL